MFPTPLILIDEASCKTFPDPIETLVDAVEPLLDREQIVLRGDVGPADRRQELHQCDRRVVTECWLLLGRKRGVGELQSAAFIRCHLPLLVAVRQGTSGGSAGEVA